MAEKQDNISKETNTEKQDVCMLDDETSEQVTGGGSSKCIGCPYHGALDVCMACLYHKN